MLESLRNPAKRQESNYLVMRWVSRLFVNAFYNLSVEGELPKTGPGLVLLPHQNDLDGPALISGTGERLFIVFDCLGTSNLPIRRFLRNSGGIKVGRYPNYKAMFDAFSRGNIVAGFPQAHFSKPISESKCGLIELVSLYERIPNRRVPIIPAGIEYNISFGILPLRYLRFPFPGTSVTVRFGEPKQLDGKSPKELTEIVMSEAAELSRIPYKINTHA